ncbi:MAG: NTP transferase domain-containing protein, partial [Pseudomonadota bacterium]
DQERLSMRVVAILQARMGSTRLKNKMLIPLLDKPLVQHVIERVQRATRLDDIVLAVPSRDAADFAPIANCRAWLYAYAGDEADLVERYLAAAQAFDADIIVRIPCDNPCVDPEYIDRAVFDFMEKPYIYYSNTTGLVTQPYRGSIVQAVDGIGCEIFTVSTLKWLDNKSVGKPQWREHPHKYFLENYHYYLHPSDIRLDVNVQQEYECIKDIFDYFGHNQFTTRDVVQYLTTKEVHHESIHREQPSGNSQQRA